MDTESPDRALFVKANESISVEIDIREFPCDSIKELYSHVFSQSREMARHAKQPQELSFSRAHELIEAHYNEEFWWDGLYRTNIGDRNPYQTGWCGGIIAEYALLSNSRVKETNDRCMQHLHRSLSEGMAPNGLFYGQFYQGRWVADHLRYAKIAPEQVDFTLTRRQGDALLYALKAIALLEMKKVQIPVAWDEAMRKNARTLCTIWRKYGQFGQFLHQTENTIELGGSANGAIIPGALALAAHRYDNDGFLDVAKESASYFNNKFLTIGLTNGGPGDAAQAPDSESCAALVESFSILYDITGDSIWLEYLKDAVHQFSTWVMPYNFSFPEGSEFHKHGMTTVGTVFANAQNKHSAPGICTHSGYGLLNLFRATGDIRYIELVRDIARAIPQYVSRKDRPIIASNQRKLLPGWINERVNTSDWDQNVGGVFYGPCWCEVSAMLIFAEIPGIYVQSDTGILYALDSVSVKWIDHDSIELHNPTAFKTLIRILNETSKSARKPLPQNWMQTTDKVSLAPRETKVMKISP